MPRFILPDPDAIKPDTPIRLEVAARLAFPDQSMTAAGLRKEVTRGRLKAWKVAGRVYTSLAEIDAMRRACEIGAKPKRKSAGPTAGDMAETRLSAAIAAAKAERKR